MGLRQTQPLQANYFCLYHPLLSRSYSWVTIFFKHLSWTVHKTVIKDTGGSQVPYVSDMPYADSPRSGLCEFCRKELEIFIFLQNSFVSVKCNRQDPLKNRNETSCSCVKWAEALGWRVCSPAAACFNVSPFIKGGEKEHPWYLLPVAYIWVSRKWPAKT